MAKRVFREYLHDEWEEGNILFEEQGLHFEEDIIDKMGRPFYEVCVTVEIDDETGEVWVTHFEGVPLTEPKRL